MRQFATVISLRGKALLIAAGIAVVSLPFSISAMRAQIPSRTAQTLNIVGNYAGVLTPPQRETPETQPPPAAPPNAVRSTGIPKWEVVSVRPCNLPATDLGRGRGGPGSGPASRFSPDRMTLNCLSVRNLIRSAYHTYHDPVVPESSTSPYTLTVVLIGGGNRKNPTDGLPDWVDTDLYTIEAKSEGVADRALMQGPMLQAILEDRFKIKVHWETREVEVNALVVAKGGSKLKPFVEGSCVRPTGASRGPGAMNARLAIKADAGGRLGGSLNFPDQGMTLPLIDVRVEGLSLSFTVRAPENPSASIGWKGSIENNGARLNGAFTQNGASMPLILTRETAQTPTPQPPAPARQRECRIEGGGLNLNNNRRPVNIVYDAEGVTIDEFVKLFMSGYGSRFVIDKTGLTGKFDIHLETEISAETRQRLGAGDDPIVLEPSTAPPFPEALQQQLGLKLESTKGPVEFHVVDHIERPSPN